MPRKLNFLIFFYLLLSIFCYSQKTNIDSSSVSIQLSNFNAPDYDSVRIGYESASYVLMPQYTYTKGRFDQSNQIVWNIAATKPMVLDLSAVLGKGFECILVEPSDSLCITKRDGTIETMGSAKYKVDFIKNYLSLASKVTPPQKSEFDKFNSIDDFWKIDKYCDELTTRLESVCAVSQQQLSPYSFSYLKANILANIEYKRLLSYANLAYHKDKIKITNDSLTIIFNSKIENVNYEYLKKYTEPIQNYVYYYTFARLHTLKNHNYRLDDPIISSAKRKVEYYDFAKSNYIGHPLQSCLTLILTHSGLKDHALKEGGYSAEIDSLLGDFYSIKGYSDHKLYVKNYELKILKMVAGKRRDTYDFKLKNASGSYIRRSDFNGKILLLNFWSPETTTSIEINRVLSKVTYEFKKDTNFLMVQIAPIKFRVKPYLERMMAHNRIASLYIPEGDSGLPVIKAYNVDKFPKLFLLDENGRSCFDQFEGDTSSISESDAFPDPRVDDGALLIESIKEKITQLRDGPYVFRQNDSILRVDYVNGGKIQTSRIKKTKDLQLMVATDSYQKGFPVMLVDTIVIPPATYRMPKKLFAISDIEGNFKALKKLLVANKIMNERFEWTFNTGHLVVNGDLFDRGKQVTECLWLLYSLEQKAQKKGGYVHIILGNHEIMNLSGDDRYTDDKYKKYASTSKNSFKNIWGNDSELGRWIRSKNIVEKIGNIVFVHGGISPKISAMNISIDSMNLLFRSISFERSNKADSSTDRFSLLLNSTESPIWYRGYYSSKQGNTERRHVLTSLSQMNASIIVTGHTIVSDTVNVHYDGRLINLDTPHAWGKSEGLLVENNRYFRVNSFGLRKELLTVQGLLPREGDVE